VNLNKFFAHDKCSTQLVQAYCNFVKIRHETKNKNPLES
jgi:hypothetical protein